MFWNNMSVLKYTKIFVKLSAPENLHIVKRKKEEYSFYMCYYYLRSIYFEVIYSEKKDPLYFFLLKYKNWKVEILKINSILNRLLMKTEKWCSYTLKICIKLSSHSAVFNDNGYLDILLKASVHIVFYIMVIIKLHYGYVFVFYKKNSYVWTLSCKFLIVYDYCFPLFSYSMMKICF